MMSSLISKNALKHYIKLGRAGDHEIQYQLGLYYEKQQDHDLAIYWMRIAHLGGYVSATLWLIQNHISLNDL